MNPLHRIRVLVSHAHDESGLAGAWKKLIETTSSGAVEVWFSSDTQPGGGMQIGEEWRVNLSEKLEQSNLVVAIQTPFSAGRPWIMWECGVASGIEKIRGIIPVVYSMAKSDLANPLSSYQVYRGDHTDDVKEVCTRLAESAGLSPPSHIYPKPIQVYMEAVALHRPRKTIGSEELLMWRDRFENLAHSGRASEVVPMRQRMYASLPKPYIPMEPNLHEVLSRILLDEKQYSPALEEIEYALSRVGTDVDLMHRKALALVQLHDLASAATIIRQIYAADANLRLNPEIASLEGRINREIWNTTGQRAALNAALEAYKRAYDADKTQHYPGINAATLAAAAGDRHLSKQLCTEILSSCREFQSRACVSFWTDFTAGEACIGLGDLEGALADYQKGLSRSPHPSPRDLESARGGALRAALATGLQKSDVQHLLSKLS